MGGTAKEGSVDVHKSIATTWILTPTYIVSLSKVWKAHSVHLNKRKLVSEAEGDKEREKLLELGYDIQLQIINYLKREVRQENRTSFFQVAANPSDFSHMQLLNFKKTIHLNKSVYQETYVCYKANVLFLCRSLDDIRITSGGGESETRRIASDVTLQYFYKQNAVDPSQQVRLVYVTYMVRLTTY